MKNKLFLMTVGFVFAFVLIVLVRSQLKVSVVSQNINKEAQHKVAILLPVSHPALEEIQQGFVDTLKDVISCDYDVYNANGDRSLLRQQAENIATKSYDLIFTIATASALVMKAVSDQRGLQAPIVASAVDDPVGLHLVNSMESSGNNITAVTGTDAFEEQISVLTFLKPSLKNVLLVYNPTSGLEKKKQTVCSIFKKIGIPVTSLEVFNINDIVQKVPAMIDQHDTVFVLKDNVVVSAIESLVGICNRKHKTLYASDLNSGDKGAVLSYGVYEYQDGVESAQKAVEILKKHKKPTEIPSSVCKNFKIKVNSKVMHQQDLDLGKNLLFVMKSGEVV